MADYPQIETNPVTIPSTEAKQFDRIWIKSVNIDSHNPNGHTKVAIQLAKGIKHPSGSWELLAGSDKRFVINDLFQMCETDSELCTLVGTLITKIGSLASAAGVI